MQSLIPLTLICLISFKMYAGSQKYDVCTDFYMHVCGDWIDLTKIDKNEHYINRLNYQLERQNDKAHQWILHANNNLPLNQGNDDLKKIRKFFNSCMNSDDIRKKEMGEVLSKWEARIKRIKSKESFWKTVLDLHKIGTPIFFAYSGESNLSDPNRYRGEIHQVDYPFQASYYKKSDDSSIKYRTFITQFFQNARVFRDVKSPEKAVFKIEKMLSRNRRNYYDRYNHKISANPMLISSLQEKYSSIPWQEFNSLYKNPESREINITEPRYIGDVNDVIKNTPLEELKTYLFWKLVWSIIDVLPEEYTQAKNSIYSTQQPIIQKEHSCKRETIRHLGIEYSRQFSSNFLDSSALTRSKKIAANIQKMLSQSVASTNWLSETAAAATAKKVMNTDLKIGAPTKWPSTGTYNFSEKNFLENVFQVRRFLQLQKWARAQEKRDRYDWTMRIYPNNMRGMAAARLMIKNGFPDVLSNSMIIPAATIFKPFFDPSGPIEDQYATLGTVISHELIHVIEFPEYNHIGAPEQLWQEEDFKNHKTVKNECLPQQISDYRTVDGHKMNSYTLNENAADLSGVKYALKSLLAEIDGKKDRNSVIREFFESYAKKYCTKENPIGLKERIFRDNHGHPRFRVNGPLQNLPEFAEVYSCKSTDEMFRSKNKRCEIW